MLLDKCDIVFKKTLLISLPTCGINTQRGEEEHKKKSHVALWSKHLRARRIRVRQHGDEW